LKQDLTKQSTPTTNELKIDSLVSLINFLPSAASFGIAENRFFLASETSPYITSAISAKCAEIQRKGDKVFWLKTSAYREETRIDCDFDCGT